MNGRPIPRIDWPQILSDLKDHQLPPGAVAEIIEVAYGTIMGWKLHDAEPKHRDGEMLLSLWQFVTDKDRQDVPRITVQGRHLEPANELLYVARKILQRNNRMMAMRRRIKAWK
jgi:hypothetical protein